MASGPKGCRVPSSITARDRTDRADPRSPARSAARCRRAEAHRARLMAARVFVGFRPLCAFCVYLQVPPEAFRFISDGPRARLRAVSGSVSTRSAGSRPLRAEPATVDVLIVAYNSRDTLRPCVEPLASVPWVDVTVVDNACPENSGDVVADLPVRIVRAPRNGGFAYGCNLGIASGSADFVLFLNPDAEIDAASLAILVDALRADASLGGVGPHTVDAAGNCDLHPTSLPPPAVHLRTGLVPPSRRAGRGLGR